jgi:hypothetical protein
MRRRNPSPPRPAQAAATLGGSTPAQSGGGWRVGRGSQRPPSKSPRTSPLGLLVEVPRERLEAARLGLASHLAQFARPDGHPVRLAQREVDEPKRTRSRGRPSSGAETPTTKARRGRGGARSQRGSGVGEGRPTPALAPAVAPHDPRSTMVAVPAALEVGDPGAVAAGLIGAPAAHCATVLGAAFAPDADAARGRAGQREPMPPAGDGEDAGAGHRAPPHHRHFTAAGGDSDGVPAS